jgi:hypothetical protein
VATTYRKEGDTKPIRARLRLANRRPPNISGATIRCRLQPKVTGIGTPFDKVCTIESAADAYVSAPVIATDLPRAVYRAEWEVTFADGTVESFPSRGFEDFVVEADLG